MIAEDGRARLVDLAEGREQRADGLGPLEQPDYYPGHDRERTFGADDYAAKVVARIFSVPAPEPPDRAVGEHDLHSEHVVGRDAVGEAVGAAGVLGNVAADRAGPLTRRVRGEIEAVFGGFVSQVQVDDAGFDYRDPVDRVDLQYLRHAREGQHDTAALRDGAAAEARAGAARNDGHFATVADLHHGRDLGRGRGQHDRVGQCSVYRPVVLEDDQVLRLVHDVVGAHDSLKLAYHTLAIRHPLPTRTDTAMIENHTTGVQLTRQRFTNRKCTEN